MNKTIKTVGIREYARLRSPQVSPEAVRKAIRDGRLKNSVSMDKQGRPTRIDPILANAEWTLNTDESYARNVKNKPPKVEPLEPHVRDPDRVKLADLPAQNAVSSARAQKEEYQGRLAKLKYEEAVGNLVDAEKVQAEAFNLARLVRDRIMGIPDRIAAELAGTKDRGRVHRRLTEELRSALMGVGDDTAPLA